MRATGLNHVSISARELAESVRFYHEVFGMEPVPTPNFGFPVQWMRVGDLQVHLFERPDEPPMYHHTALTVDDFDAIYREARRRGIHDSTTFGHHLYELPGENAQMYLRDPAGNLIEVDYPSIAGLAPDVRADMKRLADGPPQDEENLKATLFLGVSPRRRVRERSGPGRAGPPLAPPPSQPPRGGRSGRHGRSAGGR